MYVWMDVYQSKLEHFLTESTISSKCDKLSECSKFSK